MRVVILLTLLLFVFHACLAADYYKVLGLNKDATAKQIKTAFRKLSLKYHPDKNKDDAESEKKFVEVSQAYQVLSDPEQKEKYDKFGEDAFKSGGHGGGAGFQGFQGGFPGGGGGSGFGFQDPFSFFNTMFGGKGGGGNGGGMKFQFGGGQQQQQGGGGFGGFGGQHAGHQQQRGGRQQQQGNPHMYEYSADVQFLNTKKFEEKVKRGDGMWLIQFFSPNDPESQKFVDAYEKVAQSLKHYVNVGAVNVENEKSLAQEYQITSTPKLLIIPHGGYPKRPVFYSDSLDFLSVSQFALSHIIDYTHLISGVEDSFFQDQALPQVLLFSAKEVATPLYKSLARDMKNHFKFGLVPQKASQVMKNFQIKSVPSLIVVGRDGSLHPYKGEMKYPALLQFLQGLKPSTPTASAHKSVNQHRHTDGEIHQLTKNNIDNLCGEEICVVLFSENSQDLQMAKEFAVKYRNDGIAFAWLRKDAALRAQLLELTPRAPACGDACAMVALRATHSARSRFTWLNAGLPLDAREVGLVLDRLVGGDMQWTRESIPKDSL